MLTKSFTISILTRFFFFLLLPSLSIKSTISTRLCYLRQSFITFIIFFFLNFLFSFSSLLVSSLKKKILWSYWREPFLLQLLQLDHFPWHIFTARLQFTTRKRVCLFEIEKNFLGKKLFHQINIVTNCAFYYVSHVECESSLWNCIPPEVFCKKGLS